MQDNEFEKQVHKKMEELKLPPSEAVWNRVEATLQEKRRRRGLLWVPVIFLFIVGTGGYWLSTTHQNFSAKVTQQKNGYSQKLSAPGASVPPTVIKKESSTSETDKTGRDNTSGTTTEG